MAGLEDPGVFHPDADQVVDAEKAPVIDQVQGDRPIGQAIRLRAEQAVQQVKAFRVSGAAIKNGDVLIEKFLNLRIALIEEPEIIFEYFLLPVAFQELSLAAQGAGREDVLSG